LADSGEFGEIDGKIRSYLLIEPILLIFALEKL